MKIEFIKNNPLWIYIVCFTLLCGLSYEVNYYIFSLIKNVSFFDVCLFQLDNIDTVAFPLTWVFLLFVYRPIVLLKPTQLKILEKEATVKHSLKLMGYYSMVVLLFFILFIVANIVIHPLASYPYISYENSWLINGYIISGFSSPLYAMLLATLLVFLRFFCIALLMVVINQYFKKEYIALIFALALSFIDRYTYATLGIVQPLGILPIEHTKIAYTPGFIEIETNSTRIPYAQSFVYWSIIISILFILLNYSLRLSELKKDGYEK